jgi:hypothetical protein
MHPEHLCACCGFLRREDAGADRLSDCGQSTWQIPRMMQGRHGEADSRLPWWPATIQDDGSGSHVATPGSAEHFVQHRADLIIGNLVAQHAGTVPTAERPTRAVT